MRDSTLDLKSLRQSLRDPAHKGFMGRQFGRYDLISEIARGGMGVVFRAKHRELGSLVALKLLAQQDPSPEAIGRFRREAQVLAQIKHPHVVGISDLGQENSVAFLAMELIEGQTLQQVLEEARARRQPVPVERALEIALSMARALAHCHQVGAVHRDVKPHNILVEQGTGRCVLTDFGLVKKDAAKLGQGAGATAAVSQTGKILGTPSYMAPEQFEPDGSFGKVGPKADVWGLGAVLFATLTGQPPFMADNVVNLYGKVIADAPPKVSDLRPGLPEAIDDLVDACLIKNVDQRIAMDELVSRLEWLTGNLSRLKPRRSGAAARNGALLVVLLAALVGGYFALVEPEKGKMLWASVTGVTPEPDPTQVVEPTSTTPQEEASEPRQGEVSKAELDVLRKRAESGEAEAMVRLGALLARGAAGGKPDLSAAVSWFEKAANLEHPSAYFWLGLHYSQGRGVEKDDARAAEWFRRAAAGGNPSAMFWLAHMHKAGRVGGKPDPAGALDWFRRATDAAVGDSYANVRTKAEAEIEKLLAEHPDLR